MVAFEDESCLGRRLGLSVTCRHVLFSDELLLPQMKRVDGLITDNRKRLLHKLHIGQVLKVGVSPFFQSQFHSQEMLLKASQGSTTQILYFQ